MGGFLGRIWGFWGVWGDLEEFGGKFGIIWGIFEGDFGEFWGVWAEFGVNLGIFEADFGADFAENFRILGNLGGLGEFWWKLGINFGL